MVAVGSSSTVLDRRIEVINGSDEQRAVYRHISDVRDVPFYVLLGEPGMGKSSVLFHEAQLAGVDCLTARRVSEEAQVQKTPLIIDALDEYRMDGAAADKAHKLASGMKAASVHSWRLSCRAEDWRKAADISAISDTTGGQYILVIQLLPLEYDEAKLLLASFGEADPKQFLKKARLLGAEAFTENPLILKLLHKAVSKSGVWPTSRFSLFESAIRELAYEENPEHRSDHYRTAPAVILDAAEQICLRQLMTGASAILRSNAIPPEGDGGRIAYLNAHDLKLESKVLRDTLDTPLFRGEGETFEPLHKVVAEFLAGRALAKLVIGASGSAIPFSRGLALISGSDGAPPTELRGFYAWFAVHLAKLGDMSGALKLIENDAFTVLAYGDASAFNPDCRREILTGLGRDDPYFRSTQGGTTSFGGLAQEDLADDLKFILLQKDDSSHRKWTVFEALIQGGPIPSLRPILRRLMLDPQRGDWERSKALEAWLNGSPDAQAELREVFEELRNESASLSRVALLLDVVSRLKPEQISTDELKDVLRDFERRGDDRTVGRLDSLQKNLENNPRPELFDKPIKDWRNKNEGRYNGFEMTSFLDDALASTIRTSSDLEPERLYRWISNARGSRYSRVEKETATAIKDWLDADHFRCIALFNLILDRREVDEDITRASSQYFLIAGAAPPAIVTRYFLARARTANGKADKRTALEISANLAMSRTCDGDLYWQVYDVLLGVSGTKALVKKLTYSKFPAWQLQELKRSARLAFGHFYAMALGVPSGDGDDNMGATMKMQRLLDDLGQNPSARAAGYLDQLVENPIFSGWRNYIRHAQAVKSRIKRDADFKHPTPAATNEALKNGPPLNAADLSAVVVEELNRLNAELRTSDTSPWKRFWNSDSCGSPTKPLIENECRDYVLERLRDRLKKYNVVAALPEAQRANSTRVDMLVLSHAGKNLPIEVKRHYHPEVWTAAATQLQGYSADLDAGGLGIYLVIWFGTSVSAAPARRDGRPKPTTAQDMQMMLLNDLTPALQSSVEIVVFDVSKPVK